MNFYKKLGEIRPNQLMQGNIEMGFLIESHDKAKQIEEVMKEMVRMKVFGKYK